LKNQFEDCTILKDPARLSLFCELYSILITAKAHDNTRVLCQSLLGRFAVCSFSKDNQKRRKIPKQVISYQPFDKLNENIFLETLYAPGSFLTAIANNAK